MPVAVAGLAAGAGEDQVVLGLVDAGVPRLLAVDDPLVAVALGVGLHPRGVGAVLRLGDAEREAAAVPAARSSTHSAFCSSVPYSIISSSADVVADDRVLVLQVVVQPEALGREVLADDRHAEVGAVPAAVLLRERRSGRCPASSASRSSLAQQLLPLVVRQAAALPVGAGVLAAVVEEADVVVLLLERLDLRLDERRRARRGRRRGRAAGRSPRRACWQGAAPEHESDVSVRFGVSRRRSTDRGGRPGRAARCRRARRWPRARGG